MDPFKFFNKYTSLTRLDRYTFWFLIFLKYVLLCVIIYAFYASFGLTATVLFFVISQLVYFKLDKFYEKLLK